MRFYVNGSEKVRLNSNGTLLIGTTVNPGYTNRYLTIGETSVGSAYQEIRTSTSGVGGIVFSDGTAADNSSYRGILSYEHNTDALIFYTSAQQRLKIKSDGYLQVSSTGSNTTLSSSNGHQFEVNNNDWTARAVNSGSLPYGFIVQYPNATPNNTSHQFLYCSDSTAKRYAIRSNGVVESYGSVSLSDEREKKNIVALDTKWDKVKSWDLKKFHFNEDEDTDNLRYGVIAQQIEPVCPEVIDEWEKQKAEDAVLDDDGNVVTPAKEQILRKGVKEQQMMWMAIKALQEAQARIETLEAEVAALKAG